MISASHPALPATVERLTEDERPGIRAVALERLVDIDARMAAVASRRRLDDRDPIVRAVSIRVLGVVGDGSDVDRIAASASGAIPEVVVAAAAAMVRLGDDVTRAHVAAEISRLAWSSEPGDRMIAARMFGECEPGEWLDRAQLRTLLSDPDHDVVNAALDATRWPHEAASVGHVADHLRDRRTAVAAAGALVRGHESVLDHIDDNLHDHALGRRSHELLARVCRTIGGPSARAVLHRHLEHPDREVGLAVMTALAALDPHGSSDGTAAELIADAPFGQPDGAAVVSADLEYATHALNALVALDDQPSATLLCAALRDELRLVRQRLIAGLSVRYGEEALNRVVFQFAQHDPRPHALALEWLDVTLTGIDRTAVPMLEPGLSDSDRLRALARRFPVQAISPLDALRELANDHDRRWRRPWISACAIHAAASMSDSDLDVVVNGQTDAATFDDHDIVRETLVGIQRRRSSGQRARESGHSRCQQS
jgi:hypothetical protein